MTTPTLRADAAVAAGALRDWLHQGPAQLAHGPERGAVAGTLDATGRPRYVYGEITGYYLHWLSGLPDGDWRTANAKAALDWCLRRYLDDTLPPTRIYLANDGGDDWRNHVQFCFDLAMLVGGLARAERAALVVVPAELWRALDRALHLFIHGTTLGALARGTALDALPRRWSTLGGPFLAKAASRILFAPDSAGFDPGLQAAAFASREQVAVGAAQAGIDMLHPTLYAMEGALCAPGASWPAVANWLARLLAFDPGDGQLPEAPDSPVPRSDVIAQALRVSLLLRVARTPGAPDDATVDRLARALLRRVRADGSIAFRPDVEPPQVNTWCAMFAEQALRWYATASDDVPISMTAEDLV